MGGTQRLFVAVDPPRELAERLAAWARAQRGGTHGVRVVQPENIHLTLAFLGEQPAAEIDAIAGAMSAAAQSGPVAGLGIAEPLLLPPRRPRVLAAAVSDPERELAVLQANLAAEFAEAIGWGEARAFRPHLTLARLSRDARAPKTLDPLPSEQFGADELVLYRSHLDESGARYEAIERVPLR